MSPATSEGGLKSNLKEDKHATEWRYIANNASSKDDKHATEWSYIEKFKMFQRWTSSAQNP